MLSDLLTEELGWGWDGRARRHSDQLRFEVTGVPEALMAEFSQRSAAIEERKNALIAEFAAAHGRQPTNVEVLELRHRATLETRPAKEHHSLAEMTGGWRQRAERYVGDDPTLLGGWPGRPQRPAAACAPATWPTRSWPTPPAWRSQTVAERRATFSRANVLAEVHRQLHGVRFASPEDRIAVAERTADLATGQSLLDLGTRAAPHARAPAPGRRDEPVPGQGPRDLHHRHPLGGRGPAARGRTQTGGPAVATGTVAAVTAANLPGRDHPLEHRPGRGRGADRHLGSFLDVLVGPAGTGKSTTMAGLRAVWEAEHGAGSVLGLAPSAAAAEVLADELGIDTENTAKWLYEHRQEAERLSRAGGSSSRAQVGRRLGAAPFAGATTHRRGRGRGGPLAAPEQASW